MKEQKKLVSEIADKQNTGMPSRQVLCEFMLPLQEESGGAEKASSSESEDSSSDDEHEVRG